MLKKYLEKSTYHYKVHTSFLKDGLQHLVVSEFTPSGKEGSMFVIYEKDDNVYNANGDLLASVVDGEIKFEEAN